MPSIRRISLIAVIFASITFIVYLVKPQQYFGLNHVAQKPHKLVVAALEPIRDEFVYHARLSPLNSVSVSVESDGVITKMQHGYGDRVNLGELLFEYKDAELSQRYRDAVVDYLLAKDLAERARTKLKGTKAIFTRGAVPRLELESDQQALVEAEIKLVKRRSVLLEVLGQVGEDIAKIDALDLSKTETVHELFEKEEYMKVSAAQSGILLKPVVAGDNEVAFRVGAALKKGSAIFEIADDSAYMMEVKVSEVEVISIQEGYQVEIIPTAYPDLQIVGHVKKVGIYQAEHARGGQGVKFPVLIESSQVSHDHAKKLHIGMTADIKVFGPEIQALLIPLKAVSATDKGAEVQVIDAKLGEPRAVQVRVGKSHNNKVEILQGVNAGEMIVVPD